MKIPVLVSGNPSSLVNGTSCKVYLHHGDWRLVVDNLIDSQFSIVLSGYEVLQSDAIFKGPCEFVILFNKQGSEKNLNIYATDA